ncbi:ABC transporter substrate-binding protein [Lampropedia puyangensis]|uniref:ABC transporter substrate-binding protein n=1 Tax=Lampropedia puyangensis TaxID=1330072 RepID=A0A4S8EWW9_9BURK|nr:ABC transporter substrate-binding protein [Lampropedia puyangensis]THT98103.1 ABC transporter substrate-binding protein [Lampropedia puyangensis]
MFGMNNTEKASRPRPAMARAVKGGGVRAAWCAALAVGLFACSHAFAQTVAQTAVEKPVYGGTLYAAISPDPAQLNSAFHNQYANAAVSTNVLEGLVSYDQNLQPIASLATAWTVSDDGLTLTFKLREGVTWHDGEPFTAADVKFNVLEIWKKLHPRGRTTFAAVQEVRTPDAHTVVLQLSRPSPAILSALHAGESQVLPKHLYEGTDIRNNPYNAKPVGTGPFVFKQWVKGEFVELVKNPNYWDSGKPYLDRLIFRSLPDPASRAAALETGEIQYLPYSGVPFSDVERLRKNKEIALDERGYSGNSQIYYLKLNVRNPILADLRVRQAISFAIDRKGLLDSVWHGIGSVADGPIPPVLAKFYTADKPTYPLDLAKAEQLLDAAGYPRGSDGSRFSVDIDLSPSADSFGLAGEYIRQNLARVGIKATTHNYAQAVYIKKIWTDYNFDIILNGFSTLMDPSMGLSALYWSKSASPGVPYITASGYVNPELDAIIENFQKEHNEPKRIAYFHEFQRIAMRDLPMIPIVNSPYFTLYSTKVHGLDFNPNGARSSLGNVWLSP